MYIDEKKLQFLEIHGLSQAESKSYDYLPSSFANDDSDDVELWELSSKDFSPRW
jgi:hypothetical protein